MSGVTCVHVWVFTAAWKDSLSNSQKIYSVICSRYIRLNYTVYSIRKLADIMSPASLGVLPSLYQQVLQVT